jgi:hypothetical protein
MSALQAFDGILLWKACTFLKNLPAELRGGQANRTSIATAFDERERSDVGRSGSRAASIRTKAGSRET